MPHYSKVDDGGLWDILTTHQGEQFATCRRSSLPGKPFTYAIRGGEMFISGKEKSITKASAVIAYRKALALQKDEGYISAPKRIGTFGASYLYPIFLKLGFITNSLMEEATTMTEISLRPDLTITERNAVIFKLTPDQKRKINEAKTTQNSFGLRMYWIRELNGLPATKVAVLIGISPSTLRSYEDDKTIPLPKTTDKFCEVFGVNKQWLMSGDGDVFIIE